MAGDPEAEEILREREHRRDAERRRIDGERQRRKAELARLKAIDGATPRPLPPRAPPADAAPEPGPTVPSAPTAPVDREFGRPIGGAVRSPELRAFFDVDPAERFDIQKLNALRLSSVVGDASDDPALLEEIVRRLTALMSRAKQELDDPLTAGAFLRERVLEWYRESAVDPGWIGRAAPRWAGLFADSRSGGGKLQLWVNIRLAALRDQAVDAAPLSNRLRAGLLRGRRADPSVARTASQQIQAEVAQALLDDLVSRPRDPQNPHPLVRLSELGVRRQLTTVNDALALLFASPESGPFVLLHPNRYPDCEELILRPPTPGATGAALAYSLVPGKPQRRGGARPGAVVDPTRGGSDGRAEGAEDEADLDATTIWEAESVRAGTWQRVVDERRRERRRLDPPPREFRSRPAYAALRELILDDAEFRKALLAVKWRGRPTGLPLLVGLLQRGRLAPEVATDFEYLEAELGEWVEDGTDGHPDASTWTFGGWTIRRDGNASGATYRAERRADRP